MGLVLGKRPPEFGVVVVQNALVVPGRLVLAAQRQQSLSGHCHPKDVILLDGQHFHRRREGGIEALSRPLKQREMEQAVHIQWTCRFIRLYRHGQELPGTQRISVLRGGHHTVEELISGLPWGHL